MKPPITTFQTVEPSLNLNDERSILMLYVQYFFNIFGHMHTCKQSVSFYNIVNINEIQFK